MALLLLVRVIIWALWFPVCTVVKILAVIVVVPLNNERT